MAAGGSAGELKPLTLLVIDYSHDYYKAFRGRTTADGRPIVVEQTEWKDLHAEGYFAGKDATRATVRCHLRASDNPWPFSSQKEARIVEPDFVLCRNFPSDIHSKAKDIRQQLVALMYGGLPAVNSLESILMCSERPLVHTQLHQAAVRVRERLGEACTIDPIPLLLKSNQTIGTQVAPLFGGESEDSFDSVSLPAVVKVF
jgi:synapsin